MVVILQGETKEKFKPYPMARIGPVLRTVK
jgi:hypothetical protein